MKTTLSQCSTALYKSLKFLSLTFEEINVYFGKALLEYSLETVTFWARVSHPFVGGMVSALPTQSLTGLHDHGGSPSPGRSGSALTGLTTFSGEFKSSCSFSPEAASLEQRTVTWISSAYKGSRWKTSRRDFILRLRWWAVLNGESDAWIGCWLATWQLSPLNKNLDSTILIAK